MRTTLLMAMVLATFAAGCSKAPGAADPDRTTNTRVAGGRGALGTLPSAKPLGRVPSSVAGLPDPDVLAVYDQAPPKVHGPYTYHPIQVSEAHAFAAIGGQLNFKTPDGRTLSYRFERMAEHQDGSWTWVGKTSSALGGGDALITFGPTAVFGSLSQSGREPLRLTMENGKIWLVETDAAAVDHLKGSPRADDALLPPVKSADAPAPAGNTAQAPSLPSASVADQAVDVVLGYTTGFANGLGGQSQAVTRLNYLVEVTNQAYANSAMQGRIRLVQTVMVDYPDATDNGNALEQLTGYKSGTGAVTPDPRFNALRAARDTYGGDVVALVRRFQSPENQGCGIAWRLGNNGMISSSEANFAYSVVSDGRDVDETDSKTYLCREETLAHEIGHSLGQAHNLEDSSNPGVHPYSYGYRQASTSGFYTVMAYRIANSSQYSIRYFANPAVSYVGEPTGVAGVSENARSMEATMPMVQQFRAAVQSSPSRFKRDDLDGDGKSDIVWRSKPSGWTAAWLMKGTSAEGLFLHNEARSTWSIRGMGDFDADGVLDLMWQMKDSALSNAYYLLWLKRLPVQVRSRSADTTYLPLDHAFLGAGDADRNGRDDLFVRSASGKIYVVSFSNTGAVSSSALLYDQPDVNWRPMGFGDFNGDGYPDLFLRNAADGRNFVLHTRDKATLPSSVLGATVADQDWQPVGFDDFDGDAHTDVLWRNAVTGRTVIWLMGRSQYYPRDSAVILTQPDLNWRPVQTGDYNGDGKGDVMWRYLADGRNYVHFMSGFEILPASNAAPTVDPSWEVVQPYGW